MSIVKVIRRCTHHETENLHPSRDILLNNKNKHNNNNSNYINKNNINDHKYYWQASKADKSTGLSGFFSSTMRGGVRATSFFRPSHLNMLFKFFKNSATLEHKIWKGLHIINNNNWFMFWPFNINIWCHTKLCKILSA